MESVLYDAKLKKSGKIELPELFFSLPYNADLVHNVVTGMADNARTSVAHAKGRGEVRGGGKKPWRQKGTGRARHGSSRSPIWVGGGVTHGPNKNKNYSVTINKKERAKALAMIMSKKLKAGRVLFMEDFGKDLSKTKNAQELINTLSKIDGFEKVAKANKPKLYIISNKVEPSVKKAFSNIESVRFASAKTVNARSLSNHELVLVAGAEDVVKLLGNKIVWKK